MQTFNRERMKGPGEGVKGMANILAKLEEGKLVAMTGSNETNAVMVASGQAYQHCLEKYMKRYCQMNM